jgi:hypothetical protein
MATRRGSARRFEFLYSTNPSLEHSRCAAGYPPVGVSGRVLQVMIGLLRIGSAYTPPACLPLVLRRWA